MLKIVFFARLREIMGVDEISFELDSSKHLTVRNLITSLEGKYTEFNDYVNRGNRLLIAVNLEITDTDKELNPGDEIAIFPPVTGG